MARLSIQVDTLPVKEAERIVKQAFDKMGVSVETFGKKQISAEASAKQAEKQYRRLAESLDPNIKRARQLADATKLLEDRYKSGNPALSEHQRMLRLANQQFGAGAAGAKGFADSLLNVRTALAGAGIGIAIAQFKSLTKALIDAELQMQAIERRFRVAFGGNQEQARGGVEFARGVSQSYGLDFEATARGFSRIAAAAQGTALAGDQTRKVFLGVSQAAAALGLSSDEAEGALRAVEQMISKGKVQAEELRGQLGERLPGAFQIAARAMGVTTQELDEMLKKGEVLASDLLPKLAVELTNTFGPEAAKNASSLQGSINSLNTAMFNFKLSILGEGENNALGAGIKTVADAINSMATALESFRQSAARLMGENPLLAGLLLQGGSAILGQIPGGSTLLKNTLSGGGGPAAPKTGLVSSLSRYSGPDVYDRTTGSVETLDDAMKRHFKTLDDAKKRYEDVQREIKKLEEENYKLAKSFEEMDEIGRKMLAGQFALDLNFDDFAKRLQGAADALATADEELAKSVDDLWDDILDGLDNDYKAKFGDMEKELEGITRNFYEGLQSAVADSIYQFLKTGEFSFKSLWETFKDLAFRAIAQVAAKMAALKVAEWAGGGGGGGGSSTGWISALTKGLSKAGVSWGSIIGTAAVGAIVGYGIYSQKKRTREMYEQAYGGYAGTTGSARGKNSQELADALLDMLSALREATGEYLPEFNKIAVRIRNDGKYYRAEFEGELIGVFKTWQEAAIASFKKAFASTEGVNPILADVVKNYSGNDPSQLASNLREISQILRESSGMSDLAFEIKNVNLEIKQLSMRLGELGVSAKDARQITQDWAVQRFKDLRRQITGENETPQQELARRKAEATLYNAQLAMYRAELTARKKFLEARIAGVRAGAQIDQAELETDRRRLQARVNIVNIDKTILQAELDAINAALGALAGLDIDIGKLKLNGGGFGKSVDKFGGLVERWKEGVEQFRETIRQARYGSSTTALTERERLSGQYSDFRTLLASAQSGNVAALEQLPGAYTALLEIAKTYSGGGSGLGFLGLGDTFREFFNALEGLSLDFLDSGRPKKLRDKTVIFDERFHETAERTARETAAFRQQSANQNEAQIQTARRIEAGITQTNSLLNRIATTQRLGAA